MNITVHTPSGVAVFSPDQPVLLSDLLSLHQVPLAMPCGGRGKCKKCRVVATGDLSPMGDLERAALTAEEIAGDVRLACLVTVLGDATVTVGATAKTHVLLSGNLPPFPHNPIGKLYGFAVDIGTTTLAAYLYHLPSGTQLATASMLNPQATFGADVISRLQKSHEGQSAVIAASIRQALGKLVVELCQSASICQAEIDSGAITGNTAMLYLLTEQPADSLIAVPFLPDRYFGEFVTPSSLDLDLDGCESIYLTRAMAAYVGGDITSSSMAAELHKKAPGDAPCLLCDIGTNGEMVLFSHGKYFSCSTAAGPTFEGAGIHMGMTAKAGAISKIAVEDGKFVYNIIGDVEATGICGTGIIDGVAALLTLGVVDMTGRMVTEGHGFVEAITTVNDQPAFMLPGTQVIVTQADVRNVQMAKAAVCAGMLALLHVSNLDGQAIELIIAGGFGSFIDPVSAERIGLIPKGFAVRARAIGNAAGAGACMALLSRDILDESEAYSKTVTTLELSTDPCFMQEYVKNMMFI
ncbi:MAG: ASKHA domain-containing protein [Eubacteriales bacterium]